MSVGVLLINDRVGIIVGIGGIGIFVEGVRRIGVAEAVAEQIRDRDLTGFGIRRNDALLHSSERTGTYDCIRIDRHTGYDRSISAVPLDVIDISDTESGIVLGDLSADLIFGHTIAVRLYEVGGGVGKLTVCVLNPENDR